MQIQSLGLHLSILIVYQHISSVFTHLLTTAIEQLRETKKAPHNQDFLLMACCGKVVSKACRLGFARNSAAGLRFYLRCGELYRKQSKS